MMKQIFKIRFNTAYPATSKYPWRVIKVEHETWEEMLAQQVHINAFSRSTTDRLPNGEVKHHITVDASDIECNHKSPDGGFAEIIFK